MKVFVLAPQENWICDRIAAEWTHHNEDITTSSPNEADVLWLLAGWCWNHIPIQTLQNKKVVVSVHHVVPAKFDERKTQDFLVRDQFVDAYHVPNEKTAALVSSLTHKPVYVLSYWYDASMWYPEDKQTCRESIGLDDSKFVVGSFQRDTEGGTRNPKLEKGPDIFCDFVDKLKTELDVHVLLGGWRREYVIDRLKEQNINFTFIEMAPSATLRSMYNACDLYVVSSRHEGGPQSVLEAASMKVPIVSRDVGIAKDVLSSKCIIDLPHGFVMPSEEETDYNFENVKRLEIKTHKHRYISMFEQV